jgi:tight adherence protein C
MRESQRQQADEKGNRATFRLLFPTVLCLMPAVYLFLLGPAVNELQKFFYEGGADSLNNGSQIVQRINATRARGRAPGRPTAPFGQ